MLRFLYLSLLLAAACGPTLPETTSATGSTGATDSTETTTVTTMSEGTGSTGADPTTGTTAPTTGTTGEPDTTTTTTTTTGETTETTGQDLCEDPYNHEVLAQWSITFPNNDWQGDLAGECAVTGVVDEDLETTIEFSCKFDAEVLVALNYIREPKNDPPLVVGQQVLIDYREEPIFWTNRWFSIRGADDPSTVAFAGVSADHLDPPNVGVEQFYGAALAVQPGLCAPVRGPCGTDERLALEVPFGDTHTVFDKQFAVLADLPAHFDIWLAEAMKHGGNACDDHPPAWFQALMTTNLGP